MTSKTMSINLWGSTVGASGAVAAFVPPAFASLQLWLEADDIDTLFTDVAGTISVTSDADVVKNWNDKSGKANHVTEATTPPLYKTGIQNGKPVIRFDGTDDTISSAAISFDTSRLSIFFVLRAATGQAEATGIISSPAAVASWQISMDTSGTPVESRDDERSMGAPEPLGALHALIYNGTNSAGYKNGSLIEDAATSEGFDVDEIHLATNRGFNAFLAGDFAELLIYDSALSDSDRVLVETYLNDKWALF